jgi:hypothetical protein
VSHPDQPEITGATYHHRPVVEEQTRRHTASDASAGSGPVPRIPGISALRVTTFGDGQAYPGVLLGADAAREVPATERALS